MRLETQDYPIQDREVYKVDDTSQGGYKLLLAKTPALLSVGEFNPLIDHYRVFSEKNKRDSLRSDYLDLLRISQRHYELWVALKSYELKKLSKNQLRELLGLQVVFGDSEYWKTIQILYIAGWSNEEETALYATYLKENQKWIELLELIENLEQSKLGGASSSAIYTEHKLVSLLGIKDYDKAKTVLEDAIDTWPNSASLYMSLFYSLGESKDIDVAASSTKHVPKEYIDSNLANVLVKGARQRYPNLVSIVKNEKYLTNINALYVTQGLTEFGDINSLKSWGLSLVGSKSVSEKTKMSIALMMLRNNQANLGLEIIESLSNYPLEKISSLSRLLLSQAPAELVMGLYRRLFKKHRLHSLAVAWGESAIRMNDKLAWLEWVDELGARRYKDSVLVRWISYLKKENKLSILVEVTRWWYEKNGDSKQRIEYARALYKQGNYVGVFALYKNIEELGERDKYLLWDVVAEGERNGNGVDVKPYISILLSLEAKGRISRKRLKEIAYYHLINGDRRKAIKIFNELSGGTTFDSHLSQQFRYALGKKLSNESCETILDKVKVVLDISEKKKWASYMLGVGCEYHILTFLDEPRAAKFGLERAYLEYVFRNRHEDFETGIIKIASYIEEKERLVSLSNYAQQKGRNEAGLLVMRRVLNLYPNCDEALLFIAQHEYSRKSYVSARTYLERMVGNATNEWQAYFLLAEIKNHTCASDCGQDELYKKSLNEMGVDALDDSSRLEYKIKIYKALGEHRAVKALFKKLIDREGQEVKQEYYEYLIDARDFDSALALIRE